MWSPTDLRVFTRWGPPACFVSVIATVAIAQQAVDSSVARDTQPILRVLESYEVDLGERSIFYNRVETPLLKPRPEPQEAPVQTSRAPTAEEMEALREWESKEDVFLSLSATVYDREVSYVRWWREDGEYVFWSSIDFNHLRGLTSFETAESRYGLFLGIGEESRAQVERWNAQVEHDPELRNYEVDLRFPLPPRRIPGATPGRSAYQFVAVPKTGINRGAQRALDDLHLYYDANRGQIVRDFEAGEAARIAREQWVKEHPPVPKDTTIDFFPIHSSYNDGSENAGAK